MVSIGINGLGRIGRLALRAIYAHHRGNIRLAAVNDRNDVGIVAELIKRDSIHGPAPFSVAAIGGNLHLDGGSVPFLRNQPFPDWRALGAQIILECAGGGPDGNKARAMMGNVSACIISAPAPNVDAILIMGVNEGDFDSEKHRVISMASCTTNCVAPILAALHKNNGVRKARLVSLTAYTNSQRLVDAPHGNARLARAAALNIIPAESSTQDSLDILFPWLRGRYSALAYRVPVACGSVSDLYVELDHPLENLEGLAISGIVECLDEPLVSSDIIGNPHSAIIDLQASFIKERDVNIVAWYDNEWAYACRLIDLAYHIGSRL